MKEHVVIIFPHPDDESFGTAGTIINYREQGIPVTYVCGTLGEMGRNMGTPVFANRETLPQIRKKELDNIASYLDIDVKLLGYRDKTLEFEDRGDIAEHLKQVIESLDPSLVITHYPGYAIHPDHDALGAAVIEAVEMIEEQKRPRVWAQAISENHEAVLGQPDVVNDVTPIFDQKMEAILKHESQAEGMLDSMQGDNRVVSEKTKQHMMKTLGEEKFYTWTFKSHH